MPVPCEKKSSDGNIPKAEAMFSFSRKLFQLNDGKKVRFSILDASSDSAIVSNLIELGGGSALIKPNFTPNVINLCCQSAPWMKNFIIFNTSYVFACCSVNKKLSLRQYSIGKRLSSKEYREFDRDYLYIRKNELWLDKSDWKNAEELGLKDISASESSEISSFVPSDSQESCKHSPEKCSPLKENHGIETPVIEEEKENGILPEENCQESSPTCSLSPKRKTGKIFSMNTVLDNAAALEIYPENSVSQVGIQNEENHGIETPVIEEEKENGILPEENCQESSPTHSVSPKRKTGKIFSMNTALDNDATLEIYPEDSVSQVGIQNEVGRSSSVGNSSITLESKNSSRSEWEPSVQKWVTDPETEYEEE